MVWLRRVHQERMTQVHRAGVARGGHDRPMSARREVVGGELPQRQARVLRAAPTVARCPRVSRPECASVRRVSTTSENRNSISSARPFEWMFARHDRKSGVSVPKLTSMCQPASPGSSGDGNRTGERPHRARPTPAPRADELIEGGVQPCGVGGLDERGLREHAQADHRPCPGRGIVRAAPCLLPQDRRAASATERGNASSMLPHESAGDELLDLCRREATHDGRDVFHECPDGGGAISPARRVGDS